VNEGPPGDGALQVSTPERVSVELPIAGLGSRAMAYLVDVLLLGACALVAWFVISLFVKELGNVLLDLGSTVRAAAIGLTVGGLWVFWTAFEVAWNGQSPGKRLVRIRVVRSDGSPTTLFTSAVRNLLRIVDFLPTCYPVGVITMLIDKKHRRLGDLLAGTVLVRDEQVSLEAYERLATGGNGAVAVDLLELAVQFLRRFDALEPAARERVGRKLAERLNVTVPEGAGAEALKDAIRTRLETVGHG
jgi:uncharacterized RDD family membrane protein YckC